MVTRILLSSHFTYFSISLIIAPTLQQPSDTGPCHTDTEKQVEKLLSHNQELEEEVTELRQSQARSTSLFEEGVQKQKVLNKLNSISVIIKGIYFFTIPFLN